MPCQAQFLLSCLINSSSVEALKGSAVFLHKHTLFSWQHVNNIVLQYCNWTFLQCQRKFIVDNIFVMLTQMSVKAWARKLEAWASFYVCDNFSLSHIHHDFFLEHSSAKIPVLTYTSTAAGRWSFLFSEMHQQLRFIHNNHCAFFIQNNIFLGYWVFKAILDVIFSDIQVQLKISKQR